MLHYIFLILRRQRNRSILTSVGFLLAACALILLSATTQTTVLQAKQIINTNWRPIYDLVVLPPHTSVPSNAAIPSDQFEGYDGGISVQQYEQIKKLPGVDVAAPIAFVGYVPFPGFEIAVGSEHPAPGIYQLNWMLTASNGHQTVIEAQNSAKLYVPLNCNGSSFNPDVKTNIALQQLNIGPSGYQCPDQGKLLVILPFSSLGVTPLSAPLGLGTFLLAAIDPEAENHLIHLDKSLVSGRMLTEQDTIQPDALQPTVSASSSDKKIPNYDVPLLFNAQLSGKVSFHAVFSHLSDTSDPQKVVAHGGSSYLQHVAKQTVFAGDVPLARNNPQLLSQLIFDWNGHEWQFPPDQQVPLALNFTASPSGLTYQPMKAPLGQTDPAYTLVPSVNQNANGTNGSEVAFRNLNPVSGDTDVSGTYHIYQGAVYSAQPVGEFAGQHLNAAFSDALNWLPENTYVSPPAVLRYDAQGHPVKSIPLLPTTNPAGFLLQPPLALTTLAAAEHIKGNSLISVIRVRIAGRVTSDEAGWRRVTQIAQLIEQRTGLRVLVTIGSSPKPTLIYVPGQLHVAPLGWVEERWIAVGAGILYLNQLGETQTLLLGAVLLVCFGYLAVTLSSLVSSQRRELALLSALGWRPWHPTGTFLLQTLILSSGGGIAGIGLALLLISLIGASPPWILVFWTLPIVLALALLSALYPLWHLWHIQPAEALRAGTAVSSGSSDGTSRLDRWNATFWSRLPAVGGMALRNLTRSRLRAVIAIGSLFLSAILLTVMVDGLLAFRQTLQGTLLGDYVLLQTAVPQIAGATFAVLLTFLSVADLLLLQVRERQKEIGVLQAVGWRSYLVQRLFVQEGMTLALLGTVPGVLVALGVLMARHAAQGVIPAPFVGGGAVVVMLVVAGLATLPAIRSINRLPLMDVLRAE